MVDIWVINVKCVLYFGKVYVFIMIRKIIKVYYYGLIIVVY